MKSQTVFAIAVLAATVAQAAVPTGRFTQDVRYGYRDIRISQDGKSATWITKDCATCKEINSKTEPVADLGNGSISIGKYEFQVVSANALFHPSMGDFGSGTFGTIEARRLSVPHKK